MLLYFVYTLINIVLLIKWTPLDHVIKYTSHIKIMLIGFYKILFHGLDLISNEQFGNDIGYI